MAATETVGSASELGQTVWFLRWTERRRRSCRRSGQLMELGKKADSTHMRTRDKDGLIRRRKRGRRLTERAQRMPPTRRMMIERISSKVFVSMCNAARP